jgi:hypothetical protein
MKKEFNAGDNVFFLHNGKILYGTISQLFYTSPLSVIVHGDWDDYSTIILEKKRILSIGSVCKNRLKKILE